MKHPLRIALALCLLLLAVTSAAADHYYNGYVSPSGYSYQNGYWYYGNQAYSRNQYYQDGYWSYGRYYPGYYYYTYTPYYAPTYQAPAQQQAPAAPNYEDAEAAIIKIVASREKHKQFLEKLKALGLTPADLPPGYMPPAPPGYNYGHQAYGYQGHYYNNTYPVTGSTYYVPSFNTFAKSYGSAEEIAQLFQMANQQILGSQKIGADGMQRFQDLVAQSSAERATVARILAQKELALAMLSTFQDAPQAQFKGYSFKITPGKGVEKVEDGVAPNNKAELEQKLAAVVGDKCASCHTGAKPKGGFDVSNYLRMSPQDKQGVWERLTTNDPGKLMPRKADGSPGERLSKEELRLFFVN